MLCGLNQIAASAQTPPLIVSPVSADEKARQVRREAFDQVWQTVKEKHFDPNFGGADWDRVGENYRVRLGEVKRDEELYSLLQGMLGELRQSHFQILPPEAGDSGDGDRGQGGGVGMEVRLVDDAAVVIAVDPSSPAAGAGIQPGFILQQIDRRPVREILASVNASRSGLTMRFRQTRLLQSLLDGASGTVLQVVCLDRRDQPREMTLRREPQSGTVAPGFGNFPATLTVFETRRLRGNIGYLRFNIFTPAMMEKIRTAIRDFNDPAHRADGVIFDLRGNPGGLGAMATGIAGLLAVEQGSLGTMKMRANQLNFAYFPQPQAYRGPVAILIDGLSASTSEILAAGLRENGRAAVIGERSAGAALPSYLVKLSTGAIFQYAIADYKTPKGVMVEGQGVAPDLEVKLDRRALIEGKDSQLEAALDWLISKKTSTNSELKR